MTDAAPGVAAGSVEAMHEASDAEVQPIDPTEASEIEALPLAERAPRYQAIADRLRTELERSDPARGDA